MTARFLLSFAAVTLLTASDWPEWRGPHRDGVVTGEPKNWPEKLNLKWKIEVGIGHASPVMAAGSIYDFARQGDKEMVRSIDPSNGEDPSKQQYAAPYTMNPAAVPHFEGPRRRRCMPMASSTHSASAGFFRHSMRRPASLSGAWISSNNIKKALRTSERRCLHSR